MNIKTLYIFSKLLRINHWIKNFIIFIPLFFSGELINLSLLIISIKIFFLFSFVASSCYIINDLIDKQKDILHPKKSKRPLANEDIKPINALILAILIMTTSLGAAFIINKKIFFIFLIYIVLNIIYSKYIKKIAILDVIFIIFFYVLRGFIGGISIEIKLSWWLIVLLATSSLFLILSKRYSEPDSIKLITRPYFYIKYKIYIKNIMIILTIFSIFFYYFYTIKHISLINNLYLFLAIIQFLTFSLIFIYYLYSVLYKNNYGESPENFYKDKVLLFLIIIYFGTIFMLKYLL